MSATETTAAVETTPVTASTNGVARKPRAKKAVATVKPAKAAPAKKAAKANKPAATPKPAKSDAALIREKKGAAAVGVPTRGYRILKALRVGDNRMTYAQLSAKSGVGMSHLPNQLYTTAHGAGERSLIGKKLVRRVEEEAGIVFQLTALGVKKLAEGIAAETAKD